MPSLIAAILSCLSFRRSAAVTGTGYELSRKKSSFAPNSNPLSLVADSLKFIDDSESSVEHLRTEGQCCSSSSFCWDISSVADVIPCSSSFAGSPLGYFEQNICNGICETNVTMEDIQKCMIDSFGCFAVLSENVRFSLISKDKGFNSKVVLMDSLWKFSQTADLNSWPQTMVAKLATLSERQTMDAADHQKAIDGLFYNVEIDIYRHLGNFPKFLKLFGSQKFENGCPKSFLLLEYIEDGNHLNLWDSVSHHDMLQILDDLAIFHSLTPKFSKEDLRLVKNKEVLLDIFFNRLEPEICAVNLMDASAFLGDELVERKLVSLTDSLRRVVPKLFDLASSMELPEVFGHCDLWNNNIIMKDSKYRTLIDFQTCHFTQLGFEFGRLFAYLADGLQRSNILSYVEHYLRALNNSWPENQINQEKFMASWRLMFPFHYWLAIMFRVKMAKNVKNAANPEQAETILRQNMIHMIEEAEETLSGVVAEFNL